MPLLYNPLQCALFVKVYRGKCCDSQVLEDWLLVVMQLRSQLRVGKWIAQTLWFHLAPMSILGVSASVVKMQLYDHLMQGNSIGLHDENRISK